MTLNTPLFWVLIGGLTAALELYALLTGRDTLSRAAWKAEQAHPSVGLFIFLLAYHLMTPGASAVPFLVAFVAMLLDLHFGGPAKPGLGGSNVSSKSQAQ